MSKRRNEGDIVYKIPGAGFCGEGLVICVGGEIGCCMLECGDRACREWSDFQVIEDDDNYSAGGSYVYHVSECEMRDVDDMFARP